jgi:SAM-dependent methyltransferase
LSLIEPESSMVAEEPARRSLGRFSLRRGLQRLSSPVRGLLRGLSRLPRPPLPSLPRLPSPRAYRRRENLAESWDGPQAEYGLLSGWLIDARTRAVASSVTGASVLDAGCNIADLARAVPPNVDYVGLEVVPEIVDLARRLHPDRRFEICDLEGDWPETILERRFDHVALLAVVEHLRDPVAVLDQARALLAPAGTVIVTTPHPSARKLHAFGARLGLFSRDADDEHEAFFNRAGLAGLARGAGLKLVDYRRFQLGMNQLAILIRD